MTPLHLAAIRSLADSPLIFQRGEFLQRNGAFRCIEQQPEKSLYVYEVDGNYGTYRTEIQINGAIVTRCDCPYPGRGCKHVVAILLDLLDQQNGSAPEQGSTFEQSAFLSAAEIRQQALDDRRKRGRQEQFVVARGDMYKGDHLLTTTRGRQYQVTLHDPLTAGGHCSCPDFHYNKLSTCKHLIFLCDHFKEQKDFSRSVGKENFPYVDIFWDSVAGTARLFHEQSESRLGTELAALLQQIFDENMLFRRRDFADFVQYLQPLERFRQVRIQEPVMHRLAGVSLMRELLQAATGPLPDIDRFLKVTPYAYQREGIAFGLYKKAVLIGDEMGLGKTLQAIGLGLLKKEIFGFTRILVVTLSSLKRQWQREIERCSGEKACIIAGSARRRKEQYREEAGLFKITNYEAVLRDVTIISRFKPDLIILDEAQRIKNFETKTAEAVKRLPRQHALVLTGTPLENKLEDVYSLVQFLDPDLLSPLWQFAADHFLLNRQKKGDILGYVNLGQLHEKLKPIVIRRRKEEVLDELPELVVNEYFVDLSKEQGEIHAGYSQSLLPILNKKFLTPIDLRRIQLLLLKMRQVCNSTYLIDRMTNISPKMNELATILDELIIENGRKVVIFSEWTTMTLLIGKHLSRSGIPFVEFSGRIPVPRRQSLIDEFNDNPRCKVFLSTDAGGTGLNLQSADCVINFELPWNPARINQRIGRVNRIGQKSKCINVINLIARNSIEERIMAGIRLKEDLFGGVFDGGSDEVMLSREKRQQMVEKLREMINGEGNAPIMESSPAEELAEDTPYFLNPEVLNREKDFVGEEMEILSLESSPAGEITPSPPPPQSVEKMEEVLNRGIGFLSGLLEIATGRGIETTGAEQKMVTVDKETGEVTLKFKLPGF